MNPKPVSLPCLGPVPPPPLGVTWEGLMRRALFEARQGACAGEVPVGALILSAEGKILSVAHNEPIRRHDPTAHAEILALRRAGEALGNYRLDDCIMVVTLEPCSMCAAALVHARIAGLVFGAADARCGALLSCLDSFSQPFHNHHPWYMGGVLAEECATVLQEFFTGERREKS